MPQNCIQCIGVILFVFFLPRKGPFLNHLPEPSTIGNTKSIFDKYLMNELAELLIHPQYKSNKGNYYLLGWYCTMLQR